VSAFFSPGFETSPIASDPNSAHVYGALLRHSLLFRDVLVLSDQMTVISPAFVKLIEIDPEIAKMTLDGLIKIGALEGADAEDSKKLGLRGIYNFLTHYRLMDAAQIERIKKSHQFLEFMERVDQGALFDALPKCRDPYFTLRIWDLFSTNADKFVTNLVSRIYPESLSSQDIEDIVSGVRAAMDRVRINAINGRPDRLPILGIIHFVSEDHHMAQSAGSFFFELERAKNRAHRFMATPVVRKYVVELVYAILTTSVARALKSFAIMPAHLEAVHSYFALEDYSLSEIDQNALFESADNRTIPLRSFLFTPAALNKLTLQKIKEIRDSRQAKPFFDFFYGRISESDTYNIGEIIRDYIAHIEDEIIKVNPSIRGNAFDVTMEISKRVRRALGYLAEPEVENILVETKAPFQILISTKVLQFTGSALINRLLSLEKALKTRALKSPIESMVLPRYSWEGDEVIKDTSLLGFKE
jgi:hypothetical protein